MSSNKTAKKVRYALRFVPDELYIQLNYFGHFHKFADLKNPTTYNEKLNWLKLHDHNPLYTQIVDKYEAKSYIETVIGAGHTIPTIGLWEHVNEIQFELLPERYVLKCTHDSEGIVIVKDRTSVDIQAIKSKIENALKQNFYYIGREWPYKNVKPRIIAEPYLEDSETGELRDYKFFCFDGTPKVMFIASGRGNDMTSDFYDMSFNHLDIARKYPNSSFPLQKPVQFEKMKEYAKVLSAGFKHIRIDFYEVDGQVYVGEMTLYTSSGFVPFKPAKWDRIFGEWLKLD